MKLLVNAGVNLNYRNENHKDSPLSYSITAGKMDVLLYQLQKGANYEKPIDKIVNGRDVYILEALRNSLFDLNSI